MMSFQDIKLQCLRLAIDSVSDNTDIEQIISISKRYEDYVHEQRVAPADQGRPAGNVG